MATKEKYCIIGCGPAGLTVAKNFQQAQIPFDAFEKEDDVGGVWNHGAGSGRVYDSTHLISSKRLTQFVGFAMPDDYPPYPSHRQALAYLRSYADHFHLRSHIHTNTLVEKVQPQADRWEVTVAGRSSQTYRGVVIANGHHWKPLLPEMPGNFAGETLHSSQYRSPDIFRGKRVLVIGCGNSGCDIAVEAAQHADAAFLSVRRGYHFLPKFLFGAPIDEAGHFMRVWRLPLWLQRWVSAKAVNIALGSPEKFGLPAPDHRLFETHPIVNSQLLYFVGHGDLAVRPSVQRLDHDGVIFSDNRRESVDLIVMATGYKISFPFIDREHLNWRDGRPRLHLHAFHPQHDHLFVAGMFQPNSGIWGLADRQAQVMAAFITAMEKRPRSAERFRREKRRVEENISEGISYLDSPRHALEVEYYRFGKRLKQARQALLR